MNEKKISLAVEQFNQSFCMLIFMLQFFMKEHFMKDIFLNIKADKLRNKSSLEQNLAKILFRNTLKISTAESCTGGLISSRLTDVAGSSSYITMNFVTYSNESKQKILNVSETTLKKYGAVSSQCAYEMAQGLLKLTKSDVALCSTGIAGPTGDENKPIGLLYVACAYKDNITVREYRLNPNYSRKNMKFMFSEKALELAIEVLNT